MPDGFPCPNPACTHRFPAATVAGANALVCPRCGTLFQFRAAAPTPAYPMGRPVAPPAGIPVPPYGGPVQAPPADDYPEPEPYTPRKYRPDNWSGVKLMLGVLLIGGGLAGGAYYLYQQGMFDVKPPQSAPAPVGLPKRHQSEQWQYGFQVPGG